MKVLLNFAKKLGTDIKNRTSYSIDYLLSHRVEDCLSVGGIALRKAISPILRTAYRHHIDYKVIVDQSAPLKKSRKGRIFAVNHRQKEDIIASMLVADSSAYVVFGGMDIALDTFNGIGLWAYGMILIDRDNPHSRKSAYDKIKYVINHGGNVIIFPEGYWNIADDGEKDDVHGADGHNSDSWLVQDLNIGAFRLAQETECEIVPVILHYDETKGNICYGHRGQPFTVGKNDDVFQKKDRFLTIMHTEYYRLIEKYSSYNRRELEKCGQSMKQQNDAWIKHLLEVVEIPRTGYKMDLLNEKRIGKAKSKTHIVTPKEAFDHIRQITPTVENAFVFRNKT